MINIKSNFIILSIYLAPIILICDCRNPPKLSSLYIPKFIDTNQKVTLSCASIEGSEPIEYKWYYNGELIKSDDNIIVEYIPTTKMMVLVIQSASAKYNGNYSCIASNNYGTDVVSTVIKIQGPPYWIKSPHDLMALQKNNVILECDAGGYPLPKIKWFRISDTSNILLHDGKTLKINNISKKDSGKYECIADNNVGKTLRKTIFLKISDVNFGVALHLL